MKIQTSIIVSAILVSTSLIGYQELEKYQQVRNKERLENCNDKYAEQEKLADESISAGLEERRLKEILKKLDVGEQYFEKHCPEVIKIRNKLSKETSEQMPLILKELDRKERELEAIFKRNKVAYKGQFSKSKEK